MKKLLALMLVGGIVGHIITKQRCEIEVLKGFQKIKKDFEKTDENFYNKNTNRSKERNYEEIVFNTKKEAAEVLYRLDALVKVNGSATVSDLYKICGVDFSYNDSKTFWTDLSEAKILRFRHGYILELPLAVKIS